MEINRTKSTYLPGEAYRLVISNLFKKHKFPFRDNLINRIMEKARLDDNDMYFDAEILRIASVKLLEDRKRHLLLDLKG